MTTTDVSPSYQAVGDSELVEQLVDGAGTIRIGVLQEIRQRLLRSKEEAARAREVLLLVGFTYGTEQSDSCGVCHLHFEDCEEDLLAVLGPNESDDHDVPWGREYACAGARARRVLANKPQLLSDEEVSDVQRASPPPRKTGA